MSNCPSCNHSLKEGDTFCSNCGSSVVSNNKCASCGVDNPADSVFCSGCGKSLKGHQQTGLSGNESLNEFIYELDEKKLKELSKSNEQIPYGCSAAFFSNGTVSEIKSSGSFGNIGREGIANFLNEIAKFAKNLFGISHSSNKDGKQIYIVMDIKGLPVVKHNVPLKISGSPNANLSFEFWLENNTSEAKENIGLFFQSFLSEKNQLSFKEFKNIAISNIPSFLDSFKHEDLMDESSRIDLCQKLTKATGISVKSSFQRGKNLIRKQIELSKSSKPIACPNCSANYTTMVKFCEECGQDMSSINFSEDTSYLLSANGEQMIFKLTYFEDENDAGMYTEGDLNQNAFNIVQNIINNYKSDELMSPNIIQTINYELNSQLSKAMQGFVTDINLIDLRTAKEDWFFKTEALVNEELRNVEANKKLLAVEGAELDLQEAALTLALRRVQNEDTQELNLRRQTFEKRKQSAGLEVDEHALEIDVKAKKREIDKSEILAQREDDLSQIEHEKQLEKNTVLHDVNLTDITDEAKTRSRKREISLEEGTKDRDQQRQIDKMKAMSELEENMTKQDNEFELKKTETMKDMTPQEMLAVQAAKLAKTAGKEGAADVVKSIADSQAAASGSDIKDELYKKMLETQKDALNTSVESQKAATDAALKSGDQYRKINEKSMESMSKVATAKAGNKSEKNNDNNAIHCPNSECDAVYKGKIPKFCNKCGSSI